MNLYDKTRRVQITIKVFADVEKLKPPQSAHTWFLLGFRLGSTKIIIVNIVSIRWYVESCSDMPYSKNRISSYWNYILYWFLHANGIIRQAIYRHSSPSGLEKKLHPWSFIAFEVFLFVTIACALKIWGVLLLKGLEISTINNAFVTCI